MNRNRNKRDTGYYASSRRNMHSMGNGRTYQEPHHNDQFENDFINYDDGYDDNYPSPAYSMGSGNFNAGRKVNKDTGNMFRTDQQDWEEEDFRDDRSDRYHEDDFYDHNYSHELERDEEELFGQPIGRYNRNYFDTRNRENRVVRHRNKDRENEKTGKNDHNFSDNEEGARGTDWYGYYNRAYHGANNGNYDEWLHRDSTKERYAGSLRRKRPYL